MENVDFILLVWQSKIDEQGMMCVGENHELSSRFQYLFLSNIILRYLLK